MFHRRYSNCRPQNSARYNHIIKHVISWEAQAVMHIAHVCERLPRSQIKFRISRSFRLRNPANLGSEICFWIRLKEHCQHTLSDPRSTFFKMLNVINRTWRPVNGGLLCESGWKVGGLGCLVPGLSTVVTVRQRSTGMWEVQEKAKYSPFSHRP